MMLCLGSFVFSVSGAAYGALSLSASYPWGSVDRLGNVPQLQAMGREERSATLRGVVVPGYRSTGRELEALRAMASAMTPHFLVAGDGRFLGRWVVLSLSEEATLFFSDGTPRRQEFSLEIRRYD
jgi:phage protein U